MKRPLLFVSALLLVGACSTSQVFNRSQHSYVNKHDLSNKDSLHVVQGRIYRGMPIQHALAALGAPDQTDTLSTTDGNGARVKYTYRSRGSAFDPGELPRGYVYAQNEKVTEWKGLEQIPRLDAYYEGGL